MNWLKYLILGLLSGIGAVYGSWAIFTFVWTIKFPDTVYTASAALNTGNAIALVAVITVLTIVIGTILDMIFHQTKK